MTETSVIFLNGASSSGKTTLAKALQMRLDEPYVFMAEDMFFSAFPQRQYAEADFMRYGMRLYTGFTRSVRALVDCGNLVIVDTVAWVPGSLEAFVEALWDMPVCAVGVHCPLTVLEERERQRGDRGVGLARKQFDVVHANALYDVEINTAEMTQAQCMDRIVDVAQQLPSPHAFARMKQRAKST